MQSQVEVERSMFAFLFHPVIKLVCLEGVCAKTAQPHLVTQGPASDLYLGNDR